MKRLQTYISMYALLKEHNQLLNMNDYEINQFLNNANPLQLEGNRIATSFINAYDKYFENKDYSDIEAYTFILLFLNELGNSHIISVFKSISINQWILSQQMYTHDFVS